MARNAIESEIRTSKMADAAILSKISKKNKVAYRSEMARNEIESDFRTSKMATGSHFVKNFNTKEMRSKVIFGHPKWPPAVIL